VKAASSSPIQIVHSTDFQLGVSYRSLRGKGDLTNLRKRDFRRNVERIVKYIIENNIDLFLITGDIFHSPQPLSDDFVFISECIGRLASHGVWTVAIAGNHDRPRIAERRSTLEGLVKANSPYFLYVDRLRDRPISLEIGGKRISIVAIPYIHRQVLKLIDSKISYESYIQNHIAEMVSDSVFREADVRILMAHFLLKGARFPQGLLPYVEEPVINYSNLLPDKFHYIALGHIHKPQKVYENAYYAGSIERIDFSEEKDQKSFNHITLNSGPCSVEQIPLECRPMHTLSVKLPNVKNPLDLLIETIRSENIPKGTILNLKLNLSEATWNVIDSGWSHVDNLLLDELEVFGYRYFVETPGIDRGRVIDISKIDVRRQVELYIKNLDISDSLKNRMVELAGHIVDEVESGEA